MRAQIVSFVGFDFIGYVEFFDFFHVFSVTFTEGVQLIVGLTLLRVEARVGVFRYLHLMLDTLDVDVSVGD